MTDLILLILDGNYLEAIKEYLEAISIRPDVPAYYTNAAAAFQEIGEHERAVEMAHSAVDLNPSFSKAFYRRAISLMALGEFKRAFSDLTLVASREPNDVNVKRRLAECEKKNIQINFARALRVDQFDLDETAIAKLEIPDTYSGPGLSSFSSVPETFVTELIEWFKLENKLATKVTYMVDAFLA